MNKDEQPFRTNTTLVYAIVGALVVLLVGAVVFKLKGKQWAPASTETLTPIVSPTPGPITALGCENQYFNTKIGFAEYYLSVEGVDLPATRSVDCAFNVKVVDKVAAKANAEGIITQALERGGVTFRCTTRAVELEPTVPTTVDVILKDDRGTTSSCSAMFTLPAP